MRDENEPLVRQDDDDEEDRRLEAALRGELKETHEGERNILEKLAELK